MDANEEEILSCLREMEEPVPDEEEEDVKGAMENGYLKMKTRQHSEHHLNNVNVHWLELRVFCIRMIRFMINDESTPEFLTLTHTPLNQHTLLEMNGSTSRNDILSDGVSTLLKRDRLDRRCEEITFVTTDSIRTTGSLKFEVFHENILVLSGALDLSQSSRFYDESNNNWIIWNMSCDSNIRVSSRSLEETQNHCTGLGSPSLAIEVYAAGCFLGCPIVLSKTLYPSHKRNSAKNGVEWESIPEHDNDSGPLALQLRQYEEYNPSSESRMNPYIGMEFMEGEDGELSWFNAGVRVGVGIALSVFLGLGIAVALLIRTYQGTTRNFRRRMR